MPDRDQRVPQNLIDDDDGQEAFSFADWAYLLHPQRKPVACKMYGVNMNAERIAEEIGIHSNLTHPYLTQFMAPVQEISKRQLLTCGFLMDLHKLSLRSFYIDRKGDANEQQKLIWAGQLADVLAYFHIEGYCHWDVNPNNVVLSATKNLILIDLSLATSSEITRPHLTGTPGYIAPELEIELEEELGTAVDSRKADVYSYGKTIYFIFAKKDYETSLPFSTFKIPHIIELINQCLEEKPEKRPTMAEIYTKLLGDHYILPFYNSLSENSQHTASQTT